MADIGPELPPHLVAKRKRQREEEEERSRISTQPSTQASPGNDTDGAEKRRRTIGPSAPPAPLDERPGIPPQPVHPVEDDSSSDDDDFGPSLPPTDGEAAEGGRGAHGDDSDASQPLSDPIEKKPQRDEWMMMPPQQDGLAARMDPSRPRPKGFSSGKGPQSAVSGGDSTWHETAEQKQKRLANELLGIATPGGSNREKSSSRGDQEAKRRREKDEETASRMREHATSSRGPSLMDAHKSAKKKAGVEDDPSKRAFDREKDLATGVRFGGKDMMNKVAGGFSSKFSGGGYL